MRIILTNAERIEIQRALDRNLHDDGWEAMNALWVKHLYPLVTDVEHVTVRDVVNQLIALLALAEIQS